MQNYLRNIFIITTVILLCVQVLFSQQREEKKPNIILILADDQGWADTSVHMIRGRSDSKSDLYQTPNLGKMAKEGIVFSNAYSSSPVCSPSRVSIQFGKTPARLQHTVLGDILQKERGLFCEHERSIAQMVNDVNPEYTTAHFGKWGLGGIRGPEDYDVSDGNTGNSEGSFMPDKQPLPEDNPKRTFGVTKRANEFMERQVKNEEPFFMQVSYYAVHASYFALKETVEKYKNLPRGKKSMDKDYQQPLPERNDWMMNYAAMVEDLDTGLGMILNKVKELGIDDNTYIIYTSDNGGAFRGNKPLRRRKTTLWEGGIRVPTIVCGPNVLKNSYCDEPIAGWDFYATINEIIGGERLPKEYDGGSLVNLFEKGNKGEVERGTKELVFHFPWYSNGGDEIMMPMTVIRDGDFKLVRNLIASEERLYNVVKDIEENEDLSQKMPKKKEELRQKMDNYLKEVNAEDVYDMFDARITQANRFIKQEMKRENPNKEAIERNKAIIDKVKKKRIDTTWR